MRAEIIMILDRSGSMQSMADEAIGGCNAFFEEQRRLPDPATVTLVQFDDRYDLLAEGRPLSEIVPLDRTTFIPRGTTALLDAIGRTITEQGVRYARMPVHERPEKVICCVISDGLENASRVWGRNAVHALISRQRDEWKWLFHFIGANQDSYAEAGMIGIPVGQVLNTNKGGIIAAMSAMGQNVNVARATGQSICYSPTQAAAALGDDEEAKKKILTTTKA